MKAAVIAAAGETPVFSHFPEPTGTERLEVVTVSASALSPFSKSRSSGSHYSAQGIFPSVAGADGVGRTTDGRRVYFVLPEAPYGALAEKSLVRKELCVPVPDGLDDVTAAAIANPGMSAWAALVERAQLRSGETVLINGATGSAGTLAVQLAKYLGASKVIATGRSEADLKALQSVGADVVIPFSLDTSNPQGADEYEQALKKEFGGGIDVVIDYLWGESATVIITAIAKSVEDATPVRFVHVGASSGEDKIDLTGSALRSSAIQLMGSGVKSVPMMKLLDAIRHVFDAVVPAGLQIVTRVLPLQEIEVAWNAPGRPRIVVTIP
ncbi:NADPH:quinone reductase-like Zn-dependent oxidoreductase [Silvibacterium bohemicum]|uniref:NADPH:quinone reductase-like Zn-dependent oxidoreductase n=1 Tax=Silvibacterium bohemicum TaxID=1577686 RepID=A0A841JTG6_9BACT|nr:zinc-binding alcohol dehydrogenase family protein [Silvibacterium bohemicum]MBB6144450.1 NADPH:quinone reductase-like Zn-dependent oxidoreductase [Silvibacterium bohemicum]